MKFWISNLQDLYDVNEMVFFEGKLYERLHDHPKKIKYRVIINEDDYDYVVEPALRKRLNRFFNKEERRTVLV